MKKAIGLLLLSVLQAATSGQTSNTESSRSSSDFQRAVEEAEPKPGLYYLWNVETKDTVQDNFGHYIANRYYVIELLLNNQTNQKIIVTGVGFRMNIAGQQIKIAATDPQTIRGVLSKKDLVGRNVRFKNTVKTLGLMLTGASGFFKAAGAAATYNRSINIFNDPFQKGLDFISPNTLKEYLNVMNQEVFKTGLVLPEGSLGYMKVFVDKNNVFPPSRLGGMSKPQKKALYDPTEPIAVQQLLSEVVLQGEKITESVPVTFGMSETPPQDTPR